LVEEAVLACNVVNLILLCYLAWKLERMKRKIRRMIERVLR